MNSIVTSNTVKEVPMRTLIVTLFIALSLGLGACASDTETTISGTPNVNADTDNHVAVWDPDQCKTEADCLDTELCEVDLQASQELGFTAMRCVEGCTAEFETKDNVDGTSVTTKVSDSCQRSGDTTMYCDVEDNLCKPYPVEEPTEEPVEPTPAAQFVKVSCCFNAAVLTANTYAQLAWSTSDASNPEAFGKDGDLSLDANGCFTSTSKVERSKVFRGFWVELTLGLVQSLDDDGNVVYGQWLGAGENDEFAPISCEVDDEPVTIGAHMDQCGFGIDDATNLSCME